MRAPRRSAIGDRVSGHAYNSPVNPSRFSSRARKVLLTYFAALCVTLLAPFVHTVSYELVCSVSGQKVVAISDHDDSTESNHSPSGSPHDDGAGHCPLCMPAAPPPAYALWDPAPVQPLAHARESIPAARLASLVGAPLPARGPPLAS